MSERVGTPSPRALARWAGLFELLEGQASSWGQVFILNRLIIWGSPAATAANLLAHEELFRLGFALAGLAAVFHIVWIWLMCIVLRPVSRTGSFLAALVGLLACALQGAACMFYLVPLTILKNPVYAAVLPASELQALATLCLRLNGDAFNLYLVFFGLWCIVAGSLIARSTFLPRIIGVLLVVDGIGWMLFLEPRLASRLFPFIATASGLAEVPLTLWLLGRGLNSERWHAQAASALRATPIV